MALLAAVSSPGKLWSTSKHVRCVVQRVGKVEATSTGRKLCTAEGRRHPRWTTTKRPNSTSLADEGPNNRTRVFQELQGRRLQCHGGSAKRRSSSESPPAVEEGVTNGRSNRR